MDRLTTRELYSQLQDRLMINLGENEILCPECKGLRFAYIERGEKSYIDICRNCHTGKQYICKHCGKGNKTDYCECKEARQERDIAYHLEQVKKYQKAKKINYKDYDGYFLLPHSERLQELDDVRDWIEDQLTDGEEVPEYLWAVEGETHFSIDLQDVIAEKCEDGYEDMYDSLSTGSQLLDQAQELIEQWESEQGDSLCVFSETYKIAVIIKDLVDEVRTEMAKS